MNQPKVKYSLSNWDLVTVNPNYKTWDWKDLFCFWGVNVQSIIGFSLIDQNNQQIGVVKSVNDSTAQHLFVADYNGVSVLIPLVDEFIKKIDKKAQEIHLNLPEGLLDLYLNA